MNRVVSVSVWSALLISGAVVFACGGSKKPAEAPPAETTASTTAEPVSSDMPASSDSATPMASASATTPPPPAAKTLKETLGTIATVDVIAKGKKKSDFKKPADVTALMNAIGADQTAEGPLRKCADDMELQMKDKDGKVKGHVGLCAAGDMGAEFWSDGDRKGIMLSDATAVRKMLKVPTPKAAAPKKAGK